MDKSKQRLAYAITEFLDESMRDGTIKEEDVEGMEGTFVLT